MMSRGEKLGVKRACALWFLTAIVLLGCALAGVRPNAKEPYLYLGVRKFVGLGGWQVMPYGRIDNPTTSPWSVTVSCYPDPLHVDAAEVDGDGAIKFSSFTFLRGVDDDDCHITEMHPEPPPR